MALTNTQYESIIRGYQKRQTANHHLWGERRETVYEQIPGFRELDETIRSTSLSHARRLLGRVDNSGNCSMEQSMDELHEALADLSSRKRLLLAKAGFPADYLEPVYDCPDCQDTGYITPENQDGKRSSQENDLGEAVRVKCHCFRRQEISLLYEQSNIQEMIERENFTTLSFTYYEGEDLSRFRDAVAAGKEFVRNFKTEYQNLFFYGTVGTGKSFLSGCIAREILQNGHPVIYFSSSGFFETLAKYSFDNKAKETLYNFYEDLYNCDLVIIDDLGTELTNLFVNSQLFTFLNERHLRKKATIISTNLSLDELSVRYSDRIFSRITSNFGLYKLTGPDIRMLKKRMANRK